MAGVSGAESAPLKLADPSIFWDTASYVGWVPWLAVTAALLLSAPAAGLAAVMADT